MHVYMYIYIYIYICDLWTLSGGSPQGRSLASDAAQGRVIAIVIILIVTIGTIPHYY